MYLHLGQDTLVNTDDVIGLFDLDTTTISKHTRDFLALAEKGGQVVNVSTELPKSFCVVAREKRRPAPKQAAGAKEKPSLAQQVYINQLTAPTLKKRLESEQKSQVIY